MARSSNTEGIGKQETPLSTEVGAGRLHLNRWIHGHLKLVAAALTVAAGGILQLSFVTQTIQGELHDFRQAQTALLVREFMRGGFDWRSPLPVFGVDSLVPLEFPAFQWIASLLGNGFGLEASAASRLEAVIWFEICAVLVIALAWKWFSPTTAALSGVLFQILPFGVQWGHASLIEFMPVALMLAGALAFWNLTQASQHYTRLAKWTTWSLGTAAVVLAFLVKVTTAAGLTLLLFAATLGWLAHRQWRQALRETQWALPGVALGVIATGVWTRAADQVKEGNPLAANLMSTDPQMFWWNFGTVGQRLSVKNWGRILEYFWSPIIGWGLVFVLLAAITLVVWRWSGPALACVVTPVAAVGMFFNLHWVHDYYASAIYPVLVLTLAAGLTGSAQFVKSRLDRAALLAGVSIFVVGLAWFSQFGQVYFGNLQRDLTPSEFVLDLQREVPAGSGVVLLGCDWNSSVPYLSDRPALMIPGWYAGEPIETLLESMAYVASCEGPLSARSDELNSLLPRDARLMPVTPTISRLDLGNTP